MFNTEAGAAFNQEDRSLVLDSPLGQKNVLLTEVRGVEAISAPFHFDIELATSHKNDDVTDLLGKAVTLWLHNEDESDRRPVNGLVRRDRVPCCGVGAGLLSSVVCSVRLRLGAG